MEREIAIEVKNLYISYRNLQKFSIKQSLLHFKKVQADVFQAVKDVSFEVEKGEILGIIGKNGSGKSTMLKALAGIFSPDTGSIDLKNHSVSLLSIGVGFEKEMSGRENISFRYASWFSGRVYPFKRMRSLNSPDLANLLICRCVLTQAVCIPSWHFPSQPFWRPTSC